MILVDYSSIVNRMIHASVAQTNPNKANNKLITSEFINFTKYLIIQELFSIQQEYERTYGELVITLDNARNGYWRKDVYPAYKLNRKSTRDASEVDFAEVFGELSGLLEQFKHNVPWKVLDVPKAEADDLMLVLARVYGPTEKILIHSPDKDMIQAQRDNANVDQYSAMTKKWLKAETKAEDMQRWVLEHVCLGDVSDGVPKVVEHTEFSDSFKKHLIENGCSIDNPFDFRNSDMLSSTKRDLLSNFNVFKTNRKGESTGVKDIYKDVRFGPSTLQKTIQKYGSLDKWLDSHPLYRSHYERNFALVMEEGIPSDIWNEIIIAYKEAKTDYNDREFEAYLKSNGLESILMMLPSNFKATRELTADDFGW